MMNFTEDVQKLLAQHLQRARQALERNGAARHENNVGAINALESFHLAFQELTAKYVRGEDEEGIDDDAVPAGLNRIAQSKSYQVAAGRRLGR